AVHVATGVLRQLVAGAGPGEVLRPTGQGLVDRHGVVELGLRHRHLAVDHAVYVVAGADRHLVDPGEDVELGQHDVGEAVDAHGAPDHQRVVPAAAAGAACVHAHLAAGDLQVLAPH